MRIALAISDYSCNLRNTPILSSEVKLIGVKSKDTVDTNKSKVKHRLRDMLSH